MNKKGFTLLELLSAIIIISLISGIAMISYTSYVKKTHNKVFESYINSMHAEAVYYLSTNTSQIPANGASKRIALSTLRMDPIKNPDNTNDLCTDSYVDVTRNDLNGVVSLTYNVCLKCSSGYDKCQSFEN